MSNIVRSIMITICLYTWFWNIIGMVLVGLFVVYWWLSFLRICSTGYLITGSFFYTGRVTFGVRGHFLQSSLQCIMGTALSDLWCILGSGRFFWGFCKMLWDWCIWCRFRGALREQRVNMKFCVLQHVDKVVEAISQAVRVHVDEGLRRAVW